MKRINIILILFWFCLIINGCYTYKINNVDFDLFIKKFKEEEFTIYYKKKKIPDVLTIYLKNQEFPMIFANPEEMYNYSSIITNKFPNMGLVFLGISENGYGYIYYMYGHPNQNKNCILFKVNKRRVENMYKIRFLSKNVDCQNIEENILSKNYRFL